MPKRQRNNESSAVDSVARWMADQLAGDQPLYQNEAADEIQDRFGDDFTYENDNGNLAISRSVLKAFRALTEETVVWDRSERAWRRRESHDGPGRQAE
jgi:hypothetical protein